MARAFVLVYGVSSYLVFLATFLYAIAFVGDLTEPSVDRARSAPLAEALLVDALLLAAFAVQHSVMARPWFKARWTRIVPRPAERSTFVLLASLLLALLFWQWRSIDAEVWRVEGGPATVLLALQALGWVTVLLSTFALDHFDLFGLRQVWAYFRGREYNPLPLRTPPLYRWVRHPIMLGFLIAFWATPEMTAGHLLFAALSTGYIFVGIALEERDLLRFHGARYAEYRRRTSMIVPLPPHSEVAPPRHEAPRPT